MNKKLFYQTLFSSCLLSAPLCLSASGTTWDSPTTLVTSSIGVGRPSISVNDSDNGLAAWIKMDETGQSHIEVLELNEGVWGTTSTTISDAVVSMDNVRIVCNASGEGAAAWGESDGSSLSLKTALYDGESWSSPQTLCSYGLASPPKIAINSSGSVLIAWSYYDGLDNYVQAIFYDPTAGWGEATTLSENSCAITPSAAFSDMGNAIVSWIADNGSFMTAEYALYTTSWGPPQTYPCITAECRNPNTSVNAQGNAVNTWQLVDSTNNLSIIGASLYTFGVGCGQSRTVSDPAVDSSTSEVVLNDLGNAIATWSFSQGEPQFQVGAWHLDGNTWSDAEIISATARNHSAAKAALNNNNQGLAVWISSGEEGDHVESATFYSSAWIPSEIISPTGETQSVPRVSLNNLGHAYVVWAAQGSSGYSVQAVKGTLP